MRCLVCDQPARDLICRRCEDRPWADPKVAAWLYDLGVTTLAELEEVRP